MLFRSYSRLILSFNSIENDTNQLLVSSVELVLNVPNRNIKPSILKNLMELLKYQKNPNSNIIQILKLIKEDKLIIPNDIKQLPIATVKKLIEFYNLIEKLYIQIFEINQNMATNIILELIIELTHLLENNNNVDKEDGDIDEFTESINDVSNDSKDVFNLLLEDAKRFHLRLLKNNDYINSSINLKKFIDSITLESSQSYNKNAINLSTIHQMKGLESPICFIIRFNQGILPILELEKNDENPLDSNYSIDEERRIAYVAMTRAKKLLFITCSLFGRGKSIEPSQFLLEIDSKFLTRNQILTDEEKKQIEEVMKFKNSDDSDFHFDFEK